MSFLNDIYFNYYSIGTVIATTFFVLAFFFLIMIPRKTKATQNLALSYIMVAFHAASLFIGHWFYNPLAAYHRFIIPIAILLGLTHFNQIFFYFPQRKNFKTAKIVLFIQYAISILFSALYMYKGLNSSIEYISTSHYWTIDLPFYNRLLSYLIMLFIITVIINGVHSIIKNKDTSRRIVIYLLCAYVISSIIPGTANTLNRLGILDRGAFISIYAIFIVLGYFLILIIYINTLNDRISIMNKITGISLVVIFFILELISFVVLKDLDNTYITLKEKDVLLTSHNIKHSRDMIYIAGFNDQKKLISFKNFKNKDFSEKLLSPLSHNTKNITYKKNPLNDKHFVVITTINKTIQWQGGFQYREYRLFIHNTAVQFFYILLGATLLIIFAYPLFFKKALIVPIKTLLKAMDRINKGEHNVLLPIETVDEIGDMTSGFNRMSKSISAAHGRLENNARNLEHMVENRTIELSQAIEETELINENLSQSNRELEHAKSRSIQEMKMAVKVQNSFLPHSAPQNDKLDISFAFIPMKGLSGDMYDFYTHKNDLLGVSIFDVSGHGVASGLITMLAKSIIQRRFYEMMSSPLHSVLEKINEDLISDIDSIDNYLTGILLRFKNNCVEYTNAGHPDLMIFRSESQSIDQSTHDNEDFQGTFLGKKILQQPHSSYEVSLNKDDSILIFSDCLIESKNSDGEEYGIERLKNIFISSQLKDMSESMNLILEDLFNFIDNKNLQDDLTAIIIKKK